MSQDSRLVVIEAPGKIDSLKRCFSSLYGSSPSIICTYGRLYDLPKETIGVNPISHSIEDIRPIRPSSLEKLKRAIDSHSDIYLMMDDDDEGEWIAAQLSTLCKRASNGDKKRIYRCPLRAITEEDVREAFEAPRQFDFAAVYAAKARRILDREIGYLFSREHINRNGNYFPPAAVGRVVTPVLHYFCKQEDSIRHGDELNENQKPGLVTCYLIKKLPDSNGGPDWSAVVSCRAGVNYRALADKLASLPSMPIESSSATTVSAGMPDGGQWLEIISRELGLSVTQASDRLQKAYENGAISYHRSDSSRLSRAYRERLVRASRKLGVNLDLSKLEAATKKPNRKLSLSDRGAHEAPIPLRNPILGVPIESLADDDQVASVMWGNIGVLASGNESIEREYGRPTNEALSAQWANILQGPPVVFLRETRCFSGGGRRNRAVLQDSQGRLLGEELFSGIRAVKISPDIRVLQVLRHLGIGRPSTLADHAEKISKHYFSSDGTLNKRAYLAVERAREVLPELLNEDALRLVEESIYQSAPGVKHENRINQALSRSGLGARWPRDLDGVNSTKEIAPSGNDEPQQKAVSTPFGEDSYSSGS